MISYITQRQEPGNVIEPNCVPAMQKIPIEERGGLDNIDTYSTVYGVGC